MLRPVTEDIWAFDADLRLPGGMLMPSRTTIVRLAGDRLVVHSPLGISDELAREIEALGEVSTIVAPSCIHFLFLKRAMARWPKARVMGAPGLEKKVPGVGFAPLPASGAPEPFGGELLVRRIEGVPYIQEHVFLHPKTQTLVVTDLVFNIHETRGFGMPIFLRVVGAWKKTAQSRVWRFLTKDCGLAGQCVEDVLAWPFDRVVMAHGDVLEKGGREVLANALAWMVPSIPKLNAA